MIIINLYNKINDVLSATSVLLVFAVMLFDLKYPVIIDDICKQEPLIERAKERKRERERLIHSFVINCMPQIILFSLTAYVFLPISMSIFKELTFSLWNFDILITIFILVVIWIWILFIWSLILGIKLLKKVYKIKTEDDQRRNKTAKS